MKSIRTPRFVAHAKVTALMYSGPLSHRMDSGLPRHSMILSSDRITRSDGSEKSTSIANPPAVEIIDYIEQTDAAPIGKLVTRT